MTDYRKLIFISHANPEDNQFTLWLASRLTALGYLVWSDVTQLFGAERFWHDIEDAIRNHAVKVIVVLSQISQSKEGVLNEIHTALAVEKKNSFPRFVIPARIDNLPPTDIISVLIQKGYIDFYQKWAGGLANLLTLLEKDNIPRLQSKINREMSEWINRLLSGPEKIVFKPQQIVSNWFRLDSLPEKINFYKIPIPIDQIPLCFEFFDYPFYPYRDMIATFANLKDVNSFLPPDQTATSTYEVAPNMIFNDEIRNLTHIEFSDASRILSFLIRTAWDNAMQVKGLQSYVMANGRKAWFFCKGFNDDGWSHYIDIVGVDRRLRLVGRSNKYKVYWHSAMEAFPTIGRNPHLILKPHVVFSEDGFLPLSNDKRMHTVRRGFCRNWWNDRWRNLMFAYTKQILDKGKTIISLPVGSDQQINVDCFPLKFLSPVSVKDIIDSSILDDETDEQLDELAEKENWDWEDDIEEEFLGEQESNFAVEAK